MAVDFARATGRPRTFLSTREAVAYVGAVSRRLPMLAAAYFGGVLDRSLTERVMVAVSRTNACTGCTAVHQRWALRAGVTTAELAAIGAGELAALDPRNRAAIVYATALAESGFRDADDPALDALVRPHLNEDELRAVAAVARAVALANLTVNTIRTSFRPRFPWRTACVRTDGGTRTAKVAGTRLLSRQSSNGSPHSSQTTGRSASFSRPHA